LGLLLVDIGCGEARPKRSQSKETLRLNCWTQPRSV